MTTTDERRTNASCHAIVSGTGRAGTSFLVKFLKACGLDVGDDASLHWHPRARAGLERTLEAEAPYVVKDPWLFEYHEHIDLARFQIDALIIPVRDLAGAAHSRVVQERARIAETGLRHRKASRTFGTTPGGILYSLDALDQERILAVGFAQVVRWAVANELPLFLLDFPRIVHDRAYLLSALWPFLSTHCTRERAEAAFDETATPSLTRSEVAQGEPERTIAMLDAERDALVRLVDERERELASTRAELVRATDRERELASAGAELARILAQAEASARAALERLDAVERENETLRASLVYRLTAPFRGARPTRSD